MPGKLSIRVQPGARKNEVVGEVEGAIKIKIAAPPVEGKANSELISFIAKKLGVKKKDVSIQSGETGRVKIIVVSGLESDEAKRILLSE